MTLSEKEEKLHWFMIFIIISAGAFVIGLITRYLIPSDTSICLKIDESIINSLVLQKNNGFFSLGVLTNVFIKEIKFFFFAFVAGFTNFANKLFICLSFYKGFIGGFGTACLMCTIKSGKLVVNHIFLSNFVFTLLTVALIASLCLFCSLSLSFSNHHLKPFGIKMLLKRKTTYLFALDFLAFCGTALILIFIKQGNYFFMIS